MADQERHEAYMIRRLKEERELEEANAIESVELIQSQLTKLEAKVDSLIDLISVKCYGSTSVSKAEGLGSTPSTDANIEGGVLNSINKWRTTNES